MTLDEAQAEMAKAEKRLSECNALVTRLEQEYENARTAWADLEMRTHSGDIEDPSGLLDDLDAARADHDRCETRLARARRMQAAASLAQKNAKRMLETATARAAQPEADALSKEALAAFEVFATKQTRALRFRRDHHLPYTGKVATYSSDPDAGIPGILRKVGLTANFSLRDDVERQHA